MALVAIAAAQPECVAVSPRPAGEPVSRPLRAFDQSTSMPFATITRAHLPSADSLCAPNCCGVCVE